MSHADRRPLALVCLALAAAVAVGVWALSGGAAGPTGPTLLPIAANGPGNAPVRAADPAQRRPAAEAAASAAAADGPGLCGRVLDPYGRPLAGASVWIDDWTSRDDAEPLSAAESAADGTFRMPVPDARHGYFLQVRATGQTPLALALATLPSGGDLGDLRLVEGGAVHGVVVDERAVAIPGASVSVHAAEPGALQWARDVGRVLAPVGTSGVGTFRIEHLPPAAYRIAVEAAGRQRLAAAAVVRVDDGADVDVGELVLGPAATLRGIVLAPDGTPVPDAVVRARPGDASAAVSFSEQGRSDADGRFALDHVPLTKLRLEVTARGFVAWRDEALDPSAAAEVVVRLAKGLAVSGAVVDAGTGRPVERFAVRMVRVGVAANDVPTAPTAPPGTRAPAPVPGGLDLPEVRPGGRFRFDGCDAGAYRIDVRAPGHVFARTDVFALEAGDSERVVSIAVERGLAIAGRVLAPGDGRPVQGAQVALHLPPGDGDEGPFARVQHQPGPNGTAIGVQIARTTTDARGAFRFDGVEPHRYAVLASHERFADAITGPIDLRADVADLEVLLRAHARLAGTVSNIAVDATSSARVVAYGGPGRLRTADVSPDCRYAFEDLEAGSYVVRAFVGSERVFMAQHAELFRARDPAALAADVRLEDGERGELDLSAERVATGRLVGQVSENGAPVAGARVWVADGGSAVTGADGRFALADLAAGPADVRVFLPDCQVALERRIVTLVADAETPLHVDLTTGGLRGRITVAPPPTGPLVATAVWLPGADRVPERLVEHVQAGNLALPIRIRDGAYDVRGLPAGPGLLLVNIAGTPPVGARGTIPAGGVAEVDVQVDAKRR